MLRSEKERVVEQLAERLRSTETLMVADYRGLTMPEIDELRTRLLEAGARFTVVKNTLTKRAAEEAGTTEVLELIDGPTAIAFLEADGDPVAVARTFLAANAGLFRLPPGGAAQLELWNDAELAVARDLQRHAQFRLDFIEAENSMGFHAPQEAARILAESIDLSRQAQIALRDPGFRPREAQPGSDAIRRIPSSSSP